MLYLVSPAGGEEPKRGDFGETWAKCKKQDNMRPFMFGVVSIMHNQIEAAGKLRQYLKSSKTNQKFRDVNACIIQFNIKSDVTL